LGNDFYQALLEILQPAFSCFEIIMNKQAYARFFLGVGAIENLTEQAKCFRPMVSEGRNFFPSLHLSIGKNTKKEFSRTIVRN